LPRASKLAEAHPRARLAPSHPGADPKGIPRGPEGSARSRFIIFLPPLLQSLIFGYAASLDLNTGAYAVLDQDHNAASAALLSRLDGSGDFQHQANLGQLLSISRAT